MKYRFLFCAVLLGLMVSSTLAQSDVVYPYNPDADTDGYISTVDLLEILGVYAEPFAPGEIFIDGVSLGEVLINLEQFLSSSITPGLVTGDFLRWNSENSSWEPETILSDVKIADLEVQGSSIFLTGVVVESDLSVGGTLNSMNVTVESNFTASSASITNGDLNVFSGSINGVDAQLTNSVTSAVVDAESILGTKVRVSGSSVSDDAYDINNFPLAIQGGTHGAVIGLDAGANDAAPSGEHQFLQFVTGDPIDGAYWGQGAITGNNSVSALADLLNYVVGFINGAMSGTQFVSTCPWQLSFSNTANDLSSTLRIKVERAQAHTFPEGYNPTYEGYWNGDPVNADDIDDNGNCVNTDCWQYIDIHPGTSLEVQIPANHKIRLQYFSNEYTGGGDGWDWDANANAHKNAIELNYPNGEIAVSEDGATDFLWWAWYTAATPGAGAWKQYQAYCPDPTSEGSVGGVSNYNAPSTSGLGSVVEANDLYLAAVEELNLLIGFMQSTIDLIVSFFPPGIPFDAFDILDASLGLITSMIDVSLHFAALEADLGVAYSSGGADYAEMVPKLNPSENFHFGDVVGVLNGKASKEFLEVDHYMVVSKAPMVLGNTLDNDEMEEDFVTLAFLGQVRVKVGGHVEAGDYILASGYADGLAIAKAPGAMKVVDYERIVGVAWESSNPNSAHSFQYINTAIGLNRNDVIEQVERIQTQVAELFGAIETMSNQMQAVFPEFEGIDVSELSESMGLSGFSSDAHELIEQTKNPWISESKESEFAEFLFNHREPTMENRLLVADQVVQIMNERFGMDIREEFPMLVNIMEDPEYASFVKRQFEADLATLAKLAPSFEELNAREVRGDTKRPRHTTQPTDVKSKGLNPREAKQD